MACALDHRKLGRSDFTRTFPKNRRKSVGVSVTCKTEMLGLRADVTDY